jgi:drug/metabolite transporter (DMT)-like permease
MKEKSISTKTILAIIISMVSWSSSFVFIRLCLHDFTPGALALFRYLIVSATMLIFYFNLKKRHKPNLKECLQLFFLGFFGIGLYMILLNYGEITVSASITSFIIGMNPIVSMIWTMLFFGEKFSFQRWIGVGISVIGLLIIAIAKFHHGTIGWGIAYLFLAVICAGIYNVGQKPLLTAFNPIEIAAISAWVGTVTMLPFTHSLIQAIPTASWTAISAVIYLGVIPGAIGYAAWSVALNGEIAPSKLVLVLYTLPLLSTLLGWIILGEMPMTLELLGGCVALIGALTAPRY